MLFAGFMYDLAGRTWTTVTTILVGAVSTMLVPLVAPSIIGYDICRVLFVGTMTILVSNPFINDYVQVQSRGLATSFQFFGFTAGSLISVSVLFTLTEKVLTNRILSYGLLAFLQCCWAVLLWWMIDEPE